MMAIRSKPLTAFVAFFNVMLGTGAERCGHSDTPFPKCTGAPPPTIVIMLVDDMGWFNAPWNGNEEIRERMPHITKMAKEGVILDRHYSYKYCSPARSSLLSGRLPLHVTQNNKNNLVTNPGGADLRMTLLPEKLKLTPANYTTSCIGKWHVGARSVANLPKSRGFDHHFGFLKGGQDHFSQVNSDDNGTLFVDLWANDGPAYGRNGTYSTYLYAAEAERVIMQHASPASDPSTYNNQQPLFMYLAWQVMHAPLEVPPQYVKPVPNDDPKGARSKMNAMGAILDEGVANVTKALKRAGLYDNTLLLFSSDNGGWVQQDRGGNNYPLRGGKVTDFEGGVRTAAFLAGGFLEKSAPHLVGTRSDLLIHLVDWYATLVSISGGVPGSLGDWKNHGEIPGVDSLDFWAALIDPSHNVTSVRTEIPLSFCNAQAECGWPGGIGNSALISWPWKIINGTQAGLGLWQGKQFPNASHSIPMPGPDVGCPRGCLFNIRDDPTEHEDVKESFPHVFSTLWSRLLEVGEGVYQTNYDGGAKNCLSAGEAYQRDRGFLAPRCTNSEDQTREFPAERSNGVEVERFE